MLAALLELLVDVLGESLFAIAGAVFEQAVSDEDQSQPAFAAISCVIIGAVAGVISLLVLRHQVVQHLIIPGTSLILAPLCTGGLLALLGRWWVRRGNVRMVLFTFWGGFCFALGMALVRFAYFERVWTWF